MSENRLEEIKLEENSPLISKNDIRTEKMKKILMCTFSIILIIVIFVFLSLEIFIFKKLTKN